MPKEFSKVMICTDYIFMIVLIILSLFNPEISTIAVAWTAQLAISTGFYYWKAKNENRIKIPMEILDSLTPDAESKIDLTQVITSIVEKD